MAITLLDDLAAVEMSVRVSGYTPASPFRQFPAVIGSEIVIVAANSFADADHNGTYRLALERGMYGTSPTTHSADDEITPITLAYADGTDGNGGIELAPTYEEAGHSFQTVAADLNLGPDVGGSGTNPKFLAAVMGNVLGDELTKDGAYVAGVIGADSVTGNKETDYQKGAVLGVIMDGVTEADAAVVAVIDGSDPSATTRANAAFAARMNNNDAGSGVDYGLDLYDPGRGADYSDPGAGLPFAIAKAIVRTPSQVCILEGAGAPVDGTTGDNFAAKGSLYIDTAAGEAYINTGTITAPVWKGITHS